MMKHCSISLQASLEALSEFDTEAAAGIRNINHMREEEFAHLLEMEDQAPSTSRSAFMRRAVRIILIDSIDWQFQALSKVRCMMTPRVSQLQRVTATHARPCSHSCIPLFPPGAYMCRCRASALWRLGEKVITWR